VAGRAPGRGRRLKPGLVREWARKYVFAPRYARDERLWLTTEDGVRLRAHRLTPVALARGSVVLVHGFAGWSRGPAMFEFAAELVRLGLEVIVPDLRGHGSSGGRSTLGVEEERDVAAALEAVRSEGPTITVGASLGAAACLLHAGHHGGVDAVVAISAPAWWRGEGHRSASERVGLLSNSRRGRAVMAAFVRTRVATRRDLPQPTLDVVAAIAPATTVIVHDPGDHYFDGSHAEALYAAAAEPKQLWWYEGMGHGVDLFTPELAARIAQLVEDLGRGARPGEQSLAGVELLGHEEAAGPLRLGEAVHHLPEPGRVGGLDEVSQLVDDDVVDHPLGKALQRGGDANGAVADRA